MTSPVLQLNYVHHESIGYGRYGIKLAEAIAREGVTVLDEGHDAAHAPRAETVCWVSVPSHALGWYKHQRRFISTMWEAQRLPESMRDSLHNFEGVIVPSEQNRELFSRYHDNVMKVPLGIDTGDWKFRARLPPEDEFRFLIGGSGARKGLDLAAQAFKKVFPNQRSLHGGPRPTLIFKSPRADNVPAGPGFQHVGGRLAPRQEIDLYASAHVYLQPSRGEGWGLQPLQAIAQGCPTILTDAHGQAEFAYLGRPIPATNSPSEYFIYGDAGLWWEPDLDALCDEMLWCYDHYEDVCRSAQSASVIAHREFNWARCARLFIAALGGKAGLKEYKSKGSEGGAGEWVTPQFKQYPVQVLKPHFCSIAGTDYHMKPGERYYVPSDVKRILYEAGNIIDPACLDDDDNGLTVEQVATLDEYRNATQYCEHCGQKLNSGVKREFTDAEMDAADERAMAELLR